MSRVKYEFVICACMCSCVSNQISPFSIRCAIASTIITSNCKRIIRYDRFIKCSQYIFDAEKKKLNKIEVETKAKKRKIAMIAHQLIRPVIMFLETWKCRQTTAKIDRQKRKIQFEIESILKFLCYIFQLLWFRIWVWAVNLWVQTDNCSILLLPLLLSSYTGAYCIDSCASMTMDGCMEYGALTM